MRSHGSHEAVLPPASGTDSEYPYTWDDLTNQGFMFTVATLVLVWGWAISKAAVTGSQYGLLLSIPVVVLGYLAAGIGFTLITVILKRYLTIKIVFDEPIKLFSPQFAAWWLTNRFVEINHMLFMRNFRGTVILNYYYTLMGAKIAENAFVDTLDVVDFDSLEVGENTVIGEGTTIVGHTFDSNGDIVFKKIRIGEGVRVFPYSLITPDTVIRDGEELKPLAKTTTKLTSFNDQPGLEKVARTLVRSPDLTAAETTLYQIGGVTIPLLVSTVAAYVGCIMFEYFMAFLGTPVDFAPYYGVVAFVTLANPFLTIFALLMSPVAAFSLNGLVNAIPTVLASFIAVPQAFVAYAVTLVVLASFAKHLLIGKIEAGVHKRASVYGVSYWTSQRLVEITFNNVGSMVMGTWGLNSIYRMFGAQVEAFTVLRKTPAVTVPDMLKLGKWVVGGDTCKIATYLPLDQGTILSAPVVVEDQGTMGASAIILPGTTVQKQATLAPLTVSEAGSTLNASTIYIGAPATPIKLEQRPEAGVEIALPLQVLATLLPYIQIFGCLLFALASHIPAALVGHAIIAFSPGILGKFVATYVAVSIQSVVIGRLNNKLQDTVGRVEAGPGPTQWSLQYFVASANAAVTFFCACFGDCLWKGSPTWVKALRRSGLQIGKWVYLDSEWLGEPGLIEYGDRAVADRGAIVFGHLMTHNGKEFAIHFNKVNVGAGAIINARAAVMPGVQIQSGEHVPAGDLRISL